MKRVLITGITGQDGAYLADLIQSEGDEPHAVVRPLTLQRPENQWETNSTLKNFNRKHVHPCDLENFSSVWQLLSKEKFDECYHLAAQSFVAEDFSEGYPTIRFNLSSAYHLLESLRRLQPECRFYFAGSSEMFGKVASSPQNETTPFLPRSPYGISKLAAYHLVRNYRESFGMFCSCGILYNHESPRRRYEYVSRKISSSVARIKLGIQKKIELGSLDAQRDWGYAPDYVQAMRKMLAHTKPDDFVVATGKLQTVQDMCEIAFSYVDLDWQEYVHVNPEFVRKAEAVPLLGDITKIKNDLDWSPQKPFHEMICEMVERDMQRES